MQMIREGKQLLKVPWFLRPVPAEPGVIGNVLAFEMPPFYVNGGIALLRPPYSPARMAAALQEIFGLTEPKHLIQPADWLCWALKAPPGSIVELEREE